MRGNLGRVEQILKGRKVGIMDFQELVLTRRTVHNYKTDPVDDDVVKEALALSLWSPNHKLTYPWKYYRLGPHCRNQLAELSVELKRAKGPLSPVKEQAIRANVLNPSHLVAIGVQRVSVAEQAHEDYATLAGSVLIASLSLWHKGIGTKWSTGAWTTHEKSYGILGVDPNRVKLEGALMIGVPLAVPAAPERPDLSQFLSDID